MSNSDYLFLSTRAVCSHFFSTFVTIYQAGDACLKLLAIKILWNKIC